MAFSQFCSIAAVQATYHIRYAPTRELLGATVTAPTPQLVADLRWQQARIDISL